MKGTCSGSRKYPAARLVNTMKRLISGGENPWSNSDSWCRQAGSHHPMKSDTSCMNQSKLHQFRVAFSPPLVYVQESKLILLLHFSRCVALATCMEASLVLVDGEMRIPAVECHEVRHSRGGEAVKIGGRGSSFDMAELCADGWTDAGTAYGALICPGCTSQSSSLWWCP